MLATLNDVKLYLWITDTSEDTLLTSLLESADSMIKSYTSRDLEATDYTELKDWKWELQLILNNFPVNSISWFSYNTWTFATPVWENFIVDDYKAKFDEWIIVKPSWIPRWIENIKVIYNAWYTNIPKDLKQACIQVVAYYYQTKEANGVKSESVDWARIEFDVKDIPKDIFTIINKYKNV